MDMSNICVQDMISSVLPHLQFDLFQLYDFQNIYFLEKTRFNSHNYNISNSWQWKNKNKKNLYVFYL